MKIGTISFLMLSAALLHSCGISGTISRRVPVKTNSKYDFAALPHISVSDAAAIAEKVTAGRITDLSLENSDGYLVYKVSMIATDRSEKKMKIDAGNGMVVSFQKIDIKTD